MSLPTVISNSCAEGLGIERVSDPMFTAYYGEIDLEFWLRKYVGEDVVA